MPNPPPKADAGKLPKWAYIVAAGIGVLVVFFLFRKPAQSAGTTLDQPQQTTNPSDTDAIYNLTSWLQAAMSAHPASDSEGAASSGSSTGGTSANGLLPNGAPCGCNNMQTPAGATYACHHCQSGTCLNVEGSPNPCVAAGA